MAFAFEGLEAREIGGLRRRRRHRLKLAKGGGQLEGRMIAEAGLCVGDGKASKLRRLVVRRDLVRLLNELRDAGRKDGREAEADVDGALDAIFE